MGTVVPFPIRGQHKLLDDLRREASVAGDPAIIERCLRAAVKRYGAGLADKGVGRELIELEMRSMEWLLLGTEFNNVACSGKRKAKRRAVGV